MSDSPTKEWVEWAREFCPDRLMPIDPCPKCDRLALAAQRLAEEVREEAAGRAALICGANGASQLAGLVIDSIRALPLPPKQQPAEDA